MNVLKVIFRTLRDFHYRDFLVNLFTRNLGTKLMSFITALAIFYNIKKQDISEEYKSININITNPPKGMAIANPTELPDSISVAFSGTKGSLANLDINRVHAEINLTNAEEGEMEWQPVIQNIPEGVNLIKITPDKIRIRMEKEARKWVPVEAQLRGKISRGYARSVKIRPSVIAVTGPKNIIKETTGLQTEAITVSGLRRTKEVEVGLSKTTTPAIRTKDDQKFKVTIFVWRTSGDQEAPFAQIQLDTRGLSSKFQVENLDEQKISVDYNVNEDQQDLFDERMDLKFYVDLKDVKQPGEFSFPVKSDIRDFVRINSFSPRNITLTITELP